MTWIIENEVFAGGDILLPADLKIKSFPDVMVLASPILCL